MTLGIIMSRPEYITHSNSNRNDKNKGPMKKACIDFIPLRGPLIAINEPGGSHTASGHCILWRSHS